MKPRIPESRKGQQPTIFCTECGASLDEFCFSGDARNVQSVRENMNRCKHTGKFQGEICSKLYIARPELPEPDPDDPAPDA